MYQVKQFTPKLQVLAYSGKTQYDLTPQVIQARTHKAFGEPMGQWALLLTFDKRWDRVLHKMDYVEIKMSRYSKTPVTVMRGFISNIRKTRTMDQKGQYRRTITINGNDYGKLFVRYQIYYMAQIPGQQLTGTDIDPAQGLLAPLLTENLGAYKNSQNGLTPLNTFVPELVDHTVKPWLIALKQITPAVPFINTQVNVLPKYMLSWLTIQSTQGGLDGILNSYCNVPWCEWFVVDLPDAPYIVHRNAPLKDRRGNYIFKESVLGDDFKTVTVEEWAVAEFDTGSSDEEAYSYFFTYPELFTAGDLAYKFAVINSGEFGSGDANAELQKETDLSWPTNPKLLSNYVYRYGLSIMEQASPAIPVLDTGDADTMSIELSITMNMWLVSAYEWCPDMLNGTIKIAGDERVTIGRYVFLPSESEEYYVESVDHVFTVTQPDSTGNDGVFSFETTLGGTRGRYTDKPDGQTYGTSQENSVPRVPAGKNIPSAR